MLQLLMIADDFTGALDTGVQFAAHGVPTRVVAGPALDLAAVPLQVAVLAVDAETRHLSPAAAYRVVGEIVEQARRQGVRYLYKKTDSALRGNIGAELTALLEKSGEAQLAFLPALPQMGRVTVGGVQMIDGVPVAESVFGRDPFEPVKHSEVARIIGEQSGAPVHSCPPLADGDPFPEEKGILVFDAERPEDLMATGRRLLAGDGLHIMAGCAGFGAILPALLGYGERAEPAPPALDPRLLIVCGSVNPITEEQMTAAAEMGFLRLRLTPEQKLAENYWDTPRGKEALETLRRTVEEHPYCIIDSNDGVGNPATEAYAAQRRLDADGLRVQVGRSIGRMVGGLLESADLGTLLITGGDTLLSCMRHMGVREVEPICELENGVVLFQFLSGGRTRYVLSKSGGFGRRTLVADLARKLLEPHPGKPQPVNCEL